MCKTCVRLSHKKSGAPDIVNCASQNSIPLSSQNRSLARIETYWIASRYAQSDSGSARTATFIEATHLTYACEGTILGSESRVKMSFSGSGDFTH